MLPLPHNRGTLVSNEGVVLMCTRILYVGQDGLVITGRSMDWMTGTGSNIWALPAGLQRDGAAEVNPFSWTSRNGSVVSAMYDGVTVDGVNDSVSAPMLCTFPLRTTQDVTPQSPV